ncbi:hypothetical protein BIT28_25705 [Photobacterium proteolyticum]|uniref:Uncharacterized protein n=1 Tax=Photobacterium proteolyticum TaxID=1903952 RepID=A0A1Q9GFJ6_9GAMM|nr:hypothetical protein [Photobacterium proteolyticum]OLQ73216.1 hypothetical protein BIT28_25705 [Photobacterium proteolyticum]
MRNVNIVPDKTPKKPQQNRAQQQPMGFSEFNHCIDILFSGLPSLSRTQQSGTDEATDSAIWHSEFFSYQAA